MKTKIKFKPIETVAKEQFAQTKFYYYLDLRDAAVNKVRTKIRVAGGSGEIVHSAESPFNGEWVQMGFTPEGNKLYQIAAQVGLNNEWGELGDWETFRVESLPVVEDLLEQDGADYVVRNQAFHARFGYTQEHNDVLSKFKIDLVDAATNKVLQAGKWQFSQGFPTQNGLIEVKGIPAPFNITYQYSNSTQVKFKVWPRLRPWDSLAAVAFDIGQSLAEYTDLGFEILQEANIAAIKIKSKRQVIKVGLSADVPQVVCSDLIMEDFKQLFYDLGSSPSQRYKYFVQMESIRGLKTQFYSHPFRVVLVGGLGQVSGKLEVLDPYDGTIQINVSNISATFANAEQEPKSFTVARRKKGELETFCYATNTKPVVLPDEIVEICRIAATPKTTTQPATYPDFSVLDETVEDGVLYEYFLLYETPNLKGQFNIAAETIVPQFDATFIGDAETRYRLVLDHDIGSMTQKVSNGFLEPLENAYPVASYGQLNYKTGRLKARVASAQQLLSGQPVRQGLEYQLKDLLLNWLNNKKEKILQLQNGKTMIVHIVDNATIDHDITGLDMISFSWNECKPISTQTLEQLYPQKYYNVSIQAVNIRYTISPQ